MALAAAALWLLLGLAAPTSAIEDPEYSRDADKLFTRGLTAYEAGHLDEARSHFEAVRALPVNQRSSAALLMISRTQARLGDYRSALDASRQLEREAPRSRYVADALLIAGDCFHSLKRYYEAATQYARLLDGPVPLSVQASAAERLAAIVDNRSITSGALDRIRLQLGAQRLRDALSYGKARWYGRLGWEEESRQLLTAYVDSVGPQGLFYDLARQEQESGVRLPPTEAGPILTVVGEGVQVDAGWREGRAEWTHQSGRADAPRLGVLAPLSGRESAIGRDLVNGVRLANEEAGSPFDLVIVDTDMEYIDFQGQVVPILQSDESRLVRVVAGARFLVERAHVEAIVGPVLSSAAAAAAGVVEAAGVPLIAPLAQQSGLDTLGSYVFQLSPIPDVQGRVLAEYATLVLGLQTLAILSPLSDYGFTFEQAFTRTAAENGGRIVRTDWYIPEKTTDFHAQFESLRDTGFSLVRSPAREDTLAILDSLAVAVIDTTAEGEGTYRELVSGRSAEATRADSSGMFLDGIQGVAVVVENFDDARRIAAQLHFHRLRTQMLGNDIWYDPEAIERMQPTERDYVKGCVFVSRRQGGEVERAFADRYRKAFRRDPGYASSGYDAARIVFEGWQTGHRNRRALRDWLAGLRSYEGASGRISFSEERRVNTELALLTIDGQGLVRPLRPEDLPQPLRTPEDLPAESIWEGNDRRLPGQDAPGWKAPPQP